MKNLPDITKAFCFVSLSYSLLFSAGCDEASPKNENGAFVGKKDGDRWSVKLVSGNASSLYFRYAVVDGHEYLIMTGDHRSGLTHSPKCPCISTPKETLPQ